jgi:hypothetical protein
MIDLNDCKAKALSFACQYHTCEVFDGYTIEEVATGTALAIIAFEYATHYELIEDMPPDEVGKIIKAIGAKKENKENVRKVVDILTGIIEQNIKRTAGGA